MYICQNENGSKEVVIFNLICSLQSERGLNVVIMSISQEKV